MTLLRSRRSVHCTALATGAVLVLLGASGCTAVGSAATGSASAESTLVTETPAPEQAGPESTAAEDEITCAAYGDVQTIVHNAYVAFSEGRMGQQEKDGWYALASRVLGNIPSADSGQVAESLAALQEAVPAVPDLRATNIGSPDVVIPGVPLPEACKEAGFEVYTNAFTGG